MRHEAKYLLMDPPLYQTGEDGWSEAKCTTVTTGVIAYRPSVAGTGEGAEVISP